MIKSSDEPVCAGREIINKILRLTTVRQNIGMDLSSCTCKVRKEGVAVPMLIFPKGVADKIEKIKVTEFDVNLFFMQRCTSSSVEFYLESLY